MSAEVDTLRLWQAYCQECGWFGGQCLTQEAADYEADDHDDEAHEVTR